VLTGMPAMTAEQVVVDMLIKGPRRSLRSIRKRSAANITRRVVQAAPHDPAP